MASGSIRRRGDAWEVRVYAGVVDGRKRWVTATVHGGKRDAERERTRLLSEVDRGSHRGPDATVADLLDRWVRMNEARWSPATVRGYRSFLDRRILPALGPVKVAKLTAERIDLFYADCLRPNGSYRALSPQTVRQQIHHILHSALAQAVRWGWIVANPATAATPPAGKRMEVTLPTPDEMTALLAAASDPLFHAFLVLAAHTGARRAELCATTWGDLDLERGELLIARAVVNTDRGPVVKGTKTNRPRRIALSAPVVAHLRSHLRWQREAALREGCRVTDSSYLFSPDGRSVPSPDAMTARWTRLRRKAGVEGVKLHALRHRAATSLLSAGVDVRTVAGRLGHSSPATTLNVYAAWVPSADRKAAEILDSMTNG